MHQERKIEALKHSRRETSNKQETTHEQDQEHTLLKWKLLLIESMRFFSSSHLKILAMMRAKLQAFFSKQKKKSEDCYLG